MATVRELTVALKWEIRGNQKFSQFNENLKKSQRAAKQAKKATSGLASAAKRLIGVYAGWRGVKAVATTASEMRQLNSQIQEAIGSQTDFNQLNGKLYDIAKRNYKPIGELKKQFLEQQQILKGTNVTTEEGIKLMQARAAASSISGNGGAGRAMRTLLRDVAQGELTQSTFRQGLKRAPVLINHVVKQLQKLKPELGITKENFSELAQEGEITSQDLITAAGSGLGELQSRADNVQTSLSDAMTNLGTAFTKMVDGSDEASKGLDGIIKGLGWISDHLPQITTAVGAFVGAWALAKTVKMVGEMGTAIGGIGSAIRGVSNAMGAIGTMASWIGSGPIAAIIGGLVVASIAGYEIFKNWGAIKGFFSDLAGKAREAFSAMGNALADVFKEPFAVVMDYLSNKIHNLIDKLTGWIPDWLKPDRDSGTKNMGSPKLDNPDIAGIVSPGSMQGNSSAGTHTDNSMRTENSHNTETHNTHNTTVIYNYGSNPYLSGWHSAYDVEPAQ